MRPRFVHVWLFIAGMALTAPVVAQKMRPPVRHGMVLTGGFGELRPDHFHAGIDLRSSTGKPGDAVIAAAAGFVSRIIIQHDGYGQALYVQHADGRTSVYAHLDQFAAPIQKYVDQIRYARETEEIDIVLDASIFPVKQGQQIGTMGNTGRSSGVHLHFEMRDRDGLTAVDPLAFGLSIPDQSPPEITALKVYALDDKLLQLFEQKLTLRQRGNEYRIKGDTLVIGAWRVGLGIAARDIMGETRFRTGIHSIEIKVDSDVVYKYVLDKVDFRLNRYVNAHMDYAEWVRSGQYLHKCYQTPGNRLPVYPVIRKAGLITLSRWEKRHVQVTITDRVGKSRRIQFWIRRDEQMKEPEPRMFQFRIPFGEAFEHQDQDIRWKIPSGSLYETTFFQYVRQEKEGAPIQYQLHQAETPIHQYMDVAIALPEGSDSLRDKYCAVYQKGKDWYTCGGTIDDGWLAFQSRQLGTFQLMPDTVAPTIKVITAPKTYKRGGRIGLQITDNVQATVHVRNLKWTVKVNNKWLPAIWYPLSELLEFDPGKHIQKGANAIRVEVWDDRGNAMVWEHVMNG
jgi:hypothetical protein